MVSCLLASKMSEEYHKYDIINQYNINIKQISYCYRNEILNKIIDYQYNY